MNKKAGLFLSAVVIFIAIIIGFWFGLKFNNDSDEISSLEEKNAELQEKIFELENRENKIKFCPDEWINNQQPPTEENNQYFIINDERKELADFDMNWVVENCIINITTVY